MSRFSLGRTGLLLIALVGVLAVLPSSAFAAGSPILGTSTLDNFRLNTVRLHTTVDPNGGTGTTYKVEYGRTKLYGQSTPALKVTGTGAVAVEVDLPGLQPMSTYHYRVSATNNLGTTTASDQLFETLLE